MKLTFRKTVLALFLVILLIGAGIALVQLQRQQDLRGRATVFHWASTQSAATSCSSTGNVFINVSFKNREATRSMVVTAKDKQTGQSTDLGTIAAGKIVTGLIDTKRETLSAGTVEFILAWADSIDQKDLVSANYAAINSCPPVLVCTDKSVSACTWDELEGAESYSVTVTEINSGDVVTTQTVDAPETKLEFTSQTGKTYQCAVSAVNSCGESAQSKSQRMTCVMPTPSPTEVPVCREDVSVCSWDSLPGAGAYAVDVINTVTGESIKYGSVPAPTTEFEFPSEPGVTYECKVSVVNECGTGKETKSPPVVCEAPTPTLTPSVPTPTVPIPSTATPTYTPTPTIPTPTVPIPSKFVTPTIPPTLTPYPTFTPVPTLTPYPTYTPAPTATPYPTSTPRPTATPYPTNTPVPTATPAPLQPTATPRSSQPTMEPTGNSEIMIAAAGISMVLAIIGGILFFAL